jgi:DNA-binding CsgD family transcriptional regulator
VRDAAPPGFSARRFLAGDEEMVIASFLLPAASGREGAPLTSAEREVISGLLEGKSYAEIARRRGTSVDTVAKQAGSAFRKLGVSSRNELVAHGILPAPDGQPDET